MKIMIVDDEVIIRTGLAKVIKWEELGLHLLEPAASAEEALERLGRERPDILLTDIRMTGKTGLELADEARRLLPDLDIIILTGYDDFQYTQQAIRQGVNDYLLKTSRPEDIIKTVLRAKRRMEAKRDEHNRERFKNKETRDRLFERWIISGDPSGIEPGLQEAFLSGLSAHPGNGGVRMLQIWLVAGEGWTESPSSESLLLFAIENMLREMLACETLIRKKRIVAAVPIDPARKEFEHSQHYSALAKIERLLKCRIFAAAGLPVDRPERLHESYVAADRVFGYKGLIPDNRVEYEAFIRRKGGKTSCSYEEELELSAILLEDDPLALKGWVQTYIQARLEDPEFTLESLEASLHSAAAAAGRWLERVQTVTGRKNAEEGLAPFRYERESVPRNALFQYLYAVMKRYHDRLAEGAASHAQKAMAYIETNLGKDVGLQQVARHVHLHPNHLSEVFKKETGMTFGDYVTRRRMRRAAGILSTTPAKISEVAASVGYADVKYFSQLFKKETGKTPSEYREGAASAVKQD
ncbi:MULTISPECIES: helix-turn-helix domain-containing protein [Cohnella]|uniref:helix-turn-helix domain-containing protein n=1 Tax=Cohnella TaxID=329857 RepID=UPI0009BB599B|nr:MULTISPECIES: helix-turn-helix domain-containing protein [Cohnella]MBN2982118.1 response regulator [Cohnella algarum]